MPRGELVLSLVKALSILEAVGAAEDGLKLAEVADKTGMKPTTAHNLLRTLSSRRFLEKDGLSRYRLGGSFWALSKRQRYSRRIGTLSGLLASLAAEFPDAVVTFAEFSGSDIAVRLRVSPDRPGEVQEPVDRTLPLYSSATGLAFCAFADPDDLAVLFERFPFEEFGPAARGGAEGFEVEVAAVRERGCSFRTLKETGSLSVAVPLSDGTGMFVGSLGLSGKEADAAGKDRREQIVKTLAQRSALIKPDL